MEACVITYTLCPTHDLYFVHACPRCYLSYMQNRERQTREAQDIDAADLAQLCATSTPWSMVP